MNIDQSIKKFNDQLEYDTERIKKLELSTLRKVLPIYENKCKEVTKHLETLQIEAKKQNQKLNDLELQKSELEISIAKLKRIDVELGTRESKVHQELKEARVMCPIYQYKMNNFLKQFQSENKSKKCNEHVHCNQDQRKLLEQKQNIEEKINENEKIIRDFAEEYLK